MNSIAKLISAFALVSAQASSVKGKHFLASASSEDNRCWCQHSARSTGAGTLANGWAPIDKTAFAVKDASGQQCAKMNKGCNECFYRGNPCCASKEDGEKSTDCATAVQKKEYGNEFCMCNGLRVFKSMIDELDDSRDCIKGTKCNECYYEGRKCA